MWNAIARGLAKRSFRGLTKVKSRMRQSAVEQFPKCSGGALTLPNGARFYRCALQVNPFSYLQRYHKPTSYKSEEEYNNAIVAACIETKTEVIGITDHYRVKDSFGLAKAAHDAGIEAFCGFEVVAMDGVHFLCLFDRNMDEHQLERLIGECGVPGDDDPSPIAEKYSDELLRLAKKWGAVCIAAHVASSGGLLSELSGKARIKVWTNSDLLACALPGPVANAPYGIRQILENKDPGHKRDREVAILNASDVDDPEDLKKESASCFVKMSDVSIEAFRQAFLDPKSRVKLHGYQEPESHSELLAMSWEGGFMDGAAVRFNENLNVLIGGRGTGKSTVIESIRYALDGEPVGEDARKAHEGFIKKVLQPGTKISLHVRSPKPSQRKYLIERSVPNPPVVKDEDGEVMALSPGDVMPSVEIFGQHEISEIAGSSEKRTVLLERFVKRDTSFPERKSQVHRDLERSRERILDAQREMHRLDERLAALPGLEETQRRFKEAGLERFLKEKSLLVREERLFSILDERVQEFFSFRGELAQELPIDAVFVSSVALDGLPNEDILSNIRDVLGTLSKDLMAVEKEIEKILKKYHDSVSKIKTRWDDRKTAIDQNYEKLLRNLQKDKLDGEEFIQIRRRIEELRPLEQNKENLKRDLESELARRSNLLAEWEELKTTEYRDKASAAKKVSKNLEGRVRVKVVMAGNRNPLYALLRDVVGGNLLAAIERLSDQEELSLPVLVQCCRKGRESLIDRYGLPSGAAERISQAGEDLFMRVEELELPETAEIELNTAPAGEREIWQCLQTLSAGQKATAILLLLLLESEAPLVVDQPEDDLDNRFITEGVIPIIRQEKCRRKFVFSTHNANIPVLGDAELILGLAAEGGAEEGDGCVRISQKHMGSIDCESVRELVEEILEGGKAAFETRRSKYGF